MRIKAIGTITKNPNDGKRVHVDWTQLDSNLEWYFYTYLKTVWRVLPEDWSAEGLIDFTFEDKAQDIDRFRNHPYWKERFGDDITEQRFLWTAFYEEIAKCLLSFQDDRGPLIRGIQKIAARHNLPYLNDQLKDGRMQLLDDICPFTAMGMFNRSMTDANRKKIAEDFAKLIGADTRVPNSFEGIPVLNNQRSWFFAYAKNRRDGDIDALWRVFAAADKFVQSDQPESETELTAAYDEAIKVWGVSWNLSTGLYWAHPWDLPTLDSKSRAYISHRLGIDVKIPSAQTPCNGETYLKLTEDLRHRFGEENYQVHSFPELSLAAWHFKGLHEHPPDGSQQDEDDIAEGVHEVPPIEPYTVEHVIEDGCFLPRTEIKLLLERLRLKKNLILQGAPGTGKTWIARRLALALVGERDDSRVRSVQFHPNFSYEDFVRGWRPMGDGKLALVDGVFMELIRAATRSPSVRFAIVIEEINRGNPAQIFGELLTLLEAGKRTPRDAIELTYPDPDGQRRPVHIPENLYTIGTMNIADRSLALVDLALRRRFAFVTLDTQLGASWRAWVVREGGIDADLVEEIERRMTALNEQIGTDPGLGTQFQIGHSFVTPPYRIESGTTREWFRQVAETEIRPQLEEYWFDAPERAKDAVDALLKRW